MVGAHKIHTRYSRLLVCVVMSLFGLLFINYHPGDAQANTDTCPSLVTAAFNATNNLCGSTARNQMCYGHNLVRVEPQAYVSGLTFNTPGDTVPVARVRSVRGSPLDINNASWGIAFMKIQADLDNALPNENVTFLLFGDSQVTDAVPADQTTLSFTANSPVNMRSGPSSNYPVLASVSLGSALVANGRLPDSSWLRVWVPQQDGQTAWAYASLLSVDSGSIDSLPVVDPTAGVPSLGPLQAFYLTTNDSKLNCNQLPENGLLIQTPEGAGTVRLYINEVKVDIGSTVFFQANPNGDMVISTLEGMALVEAEGHTEAAAAGSQLTIPLDGDSKPAGPPNMPQPYNQEEFQNFPVNVLERPITVAPPLSEPDIEVIHQHVQANQPLCGIKPLLPCTTAAIDGIVTAIGPDSITVDGTVVYLDPNDPIRKRLRIGMHLHIAGNMNSDGTELIAVKIIIRPPTGSNPNGNAYGLSNGRGNGRPDSPGNSANSNAGGGGRPDNPGSNSNAGGGGMGN